jgi:hypothetical protein
MLLMDPQAGITVAAEAMACTPMGRPDRINAYDERKTERL